MAEEQPKQGGTEPNGTVDPDYKAMYEEARAKLDETLKHSREWERRAKDYKPAHDELEQLKASQMSETERLKKQLDEQRSRADALEAAAERERWVQEVAEKTGLTPSQLRVIDAADADDLAAKAALFAPEPKDAAKPPVPVVLGQGKRPEKSPGGSPAEDFAAYMQQFNR